MRWLLLKTNRCPQCSKDFMKGLIVTPGGKIDDQGEMDMRDNMMHHPCGFMITESEYKRIVSEMVIKTIKQRPERSNYYKFYF